MSRGGPRRTTSLSPAAVAEIQARVGAGESGRAVAAEFDVSPATVSRAARGLLQVREAGGGSSMTADAWEPLCMDARDWRDWQRLNPRNLGGHSVADRPCADCPASFAAEMRAEGKCNGSPGWRPPADDIEEADVGDAITISNVSISAPCGSCSHAAVCSIKATLGGLEEADVTIPKPDPALTVALALSVECSHYLRRSGSTTGRRLNLTPEDRAARAERLRAVNEAGRIAAGERAAS